MTNIPTIECATILAGRLVLAGVLSALIGIEREFRAKEAGLRTHFLVGVGSALFMIVSQYGFADVGGPDGITLAGVNRGDAARVAAQIVTGIGFIGAGAIMVQRHYVRGLTTAAGLWVVAAIGMSAGGGLTIMAVLGTVFALIGLELFRVLMKWVNLRMLEITFKATDTAAVDRMLAAIAAQECKVSSYKIVGTGTGYIRVQVSARDRSRTDGPLPLYESLAEVEGAKVETIE